MKKAYHKESVVGQASRGCHGGWLKDVPQSAKVTKHFYRRLRFMWYTLFDHQRRHYQRWGSMVHNWHAWMPLSHPLVNASAETFYRLCKDYPKPLFGITHVRKPGEDITVDPSVPVTEQDIIVKPFCTLKRFDKQTQTKTKKPHVCFLVAPLSGHYATLLRDTVKGLLVHCDTVYITDWANARDVPLSHGTFHLHTYVHYLEEFLQIIPERVHTIGVCQPVVPLLIATSRMAAKKDPKRPLSMVLMGGPVDTRQSPTSVNEYAKKHTMEWFRRHVIDFVPLGYPGAGRLVYPGFLQHFGFVAMNPQRHAQAYRDFFNQLVQGDRNSAERHREFYDEYNAVLDLDAAYYLETLRHVFMEHSLPNRTLVIDQELVDPAIIDDVALMTIEGENDDIAGIGQTRAAHDVCARIPDNLREHWQVPGVGHYGVFSGTYFRTHIAPKIIQWQQQVDKKRAKSSRTSYV